MNNKLLEVFNHKFKHVEFNQDLIKKIERFKLNWSEKSDQYIDFMSSPLMGVYKVRFSTKDEYEFFYEIFRINPSLLEEEIKKTKEIPNHFKVAGNAFNLTVIYVIYRFVLVYHTKDKENELKKVIQELYQIIALKMLGSIFSYYFRFGCDESIAQTAYQNLSNKYMIKKEGSWAGVLLNMASVLYPDGPHKDRISVFNAENCIRLISDINTRLRSVVKNYSAEIYAVKTSTEAGNKIITSTLLQNSEEGDSLKDITLGVNNQVNYLKSIISSPNDFVHSVKVKLICSVMKNIKPDKLTTVLYYISTEHPVPKQGEIDYCAIPIKQSAAYLQSKNIKYDIKVKILECLMTLKKYYSSSTVRNDDIYKTKKILDQFVKEALVDQKNWLSPPLVIGVILYMYLISIR